MTVVNRRHVVVTSALVAIAGAYAGYRITSSPSYAIRQLVTAVREHDAATAREYLDIRATSKQVVDEVMERTVSKALIDSDDGGFAALGAALGMSMIERMKPVMVASLQKSIEELMARKPETTVAQAGSTLGQDSQTAVGLLSRVRVKARTFVGIGETRRDGDSAAVDLRIAHDDLDTTLTVTASLRKRNGKWRIVGIDDVGGYMDRLEAVEGVRLAAINEPIRQRLRSLIRVGNLNVEYEKIGYFSEYLTLRVPIRNESRDTVLALMLALDGPKVDGRTGQSVVWDPDDGPIPPGRTVAARSFVSYNEFMNGHNDLRFRPNAFKPRIELVVIKRGQAADTVHEFESWSDYRARRLMSFTGKAH